MYMYIVLDAEFERCERKVKIEYDVYIRQWKENHENVNVALVSAVN